ncbi:hypothetical protein HPB50_023975 [Hyalomma asiaticum]|uniref:Uncharacterized protein n=1 Tax=Hyalomma asiaticum TaxID=266040 RepID=A0ACB7S2J8_HYAAI|nr:hypothetical protein HPB50_023975 [Hyalomma asiaticum]
MMFYNQSSLRDLIREIVREEIQKLHNLTHTEAPTVSITEVVRDEITQALKTTPYPEYQQFPTSYAAALERSPPVVPAPAVSPRIDRPYHQQSAAVALSPPTPEAVMRPSVASSRRQQYNEAPGSPPREETSRRQNLRRTDVWHIVDRRPLCFQCGGAGHISRYCWYRDVSIISPCSVVV